MTYKSERRMDLPESETVLFLLHHSIFVPGIGRLIAVK